jgi:hypothetical protein
VAAFSLGVLVGCSGSAAFRIPLYPRHVPTLRSRSAVVARPPWDPQRWVERYGCSLARVFDDHA